jgi:uncharacterized protein (TIGR02001 family)
VLRGALALLTAFVATASIAQVSATASLVSDYRVRGVSLSNGNPAAQLDLSYDHESGWYGGTFFSNVEFDPQTGQQLQFAGYGGYARRLGHGWSLDAGATYQDFSNDSDYRYVEAHVGVTTDAASARLYYSPNYFGVSIHTLYAELNGSYRLDDRFKLVGHAGMLQAFAGATDQAGGDHPHADFLAGIEWQRRPFSLQVARVFSNSAARVYPVASSHANGVVTVRLSAGF